MTDDELEALDPELREAVVAALHPVSADVWPPEDVHGCRGSSDEIEIVLRHAGCVDCLGVVTPALRELVTNGPA